MKEFKASYPIYKSELDLKYWNSFKINFIKQKMWSK